MVLGLSVYVAVKVHGILIAAIIFVLKRSYDDRTGSCSWLLQVLAIGYSADAHNLSTSSMCLNVTDGCGSNPRGGDCIKTCDKN